MRGCVPEASCLFLGARLPHSFLGRGPLPPCEESSGCSQQEETEKTAIAKTSKFFLFFCLSEKCSAPFPSAPCTHAACQGKLSPGCTDTGSIVCPTPRCPQECKFVYGMFCCVFIFPAHRKQDLFLLKINVGSSFFPPVAPTALVRRFQKGL